MKFSAELISIGSELLSGRTLNSHARDLGGQLGAIGLELLRDTTIPDDIETIRSAVKEALNRIHLVFVSGGLGPTVDDITRDALSDLLERKIVSHLPTVEYLRSWYSGRGRTSNPVVERQALVLQGAAVLPNPVGAAPGQRIDLPDGKILFLLPGPPDEFNAVLVDSIIPWLRERFADARPKLVRIVRTEGIGESDIVIILDKAGFQPAGIDLGFYPGMGKVEIRLTTTPDNGDRLDQSEQLLLTLLADFLE